MIPVLVLSLFVGIYFIQHAKQTVTLPVYGAVPAFHLTDSTGAKFRWQIFNRKALGRRIYVYALSRSISLKFKVSRAADLGT